VTAEERKKAGGNKEEEERVSDRGPTKNAVPINVEKFVLIYGIKKVSLHPPVSVIEARCPSMEGCNLSAKRQQCNNLVQHL
jgi:hypothetical protein